MGEEMIPPGTVAAIAAALMAQGMDFREGSDIWPKRSRFRMSYIENYVSIACDIAEETERQLSVRASKGAEP